MSRSLISQSWRGTGCKELGAAAVAALLAGPGVLISAQEFPRATVKVWDTAAPVPPSISQGMTPGESVDDATGLTRHGTSFPTIATVYANSSHPSGPSGISYWNPDANLFTWYGKTIGFPGGVDINRNGPILAATSLVFGSFTFGPGDVWIGGQQNEPLYVHLAGTDRFRTYGTSSPLVPSATRVWGVKVDEQTGHVFVAQPAEGRITRLDPVTGKTTVWELGGGLPAGITLDTAGRPYSTLSRVDWVLRVDHGPDRVLGTEDDDIIFWRVPNLDGIRSFRDVPPPALQEEYPNAIITTDAGGNIWFTQSNSDEIGRLGAGPDGVLGSWDDSICEYSIDGLVNPQQIAGTGSGSSLQVYFTEGEGNSVSILTATEAEMATFPIQVCTTVPAEQLPDFRMFQAQTVFFDEEIAPLRTAIVPTIHEVKGLGGFASGTATTAEGSPLPPILRFSPMPNPILSANGDPMGDAGNGFPSGITGVYATNRIGGAFLKGNKHFELVSRAVIAQQAAPLGGTPGRLTGGGKTVTTNGTRITHGMILECTAAVAASDQRSALQVNWDDGHRFHLTRVTDASCSDDPSLDPGPADVGEPPASFDTHSGRGVGRYDGMEGATIEWTFTDAGEPGRHDSARIVISDSTGRAVLEVDATLNGGNHQAHAETAR